jgi:hypothetical protein
MENDPPTGLLHVSPWREQVQQSAADLFDTTLRHQAEGRLHSQANANIADYTSAVREGEADMSFHETPQLEHLSQPLADALAGKGNMPGEYQFSYLYQYLAAWQGSGMGGL